MSTQTQPAEQLMTIREVCAALRVQRGCLYGLQRRGALSFVKIGRAARIRRSDVERLMQAGASK